MTFHHTFRLVEVIVLYKVKVLLKCFINVIIAVYKAYHQIDIFFFLKKKTRLRFDGIPCLCFIGILDIFEVLLNELFYFFFFEAKQLFRKILGFKSFDMTFRCLISDLLVFIDFLSFFSVSFIDLLEVLTMRIFVWMVVCQSAGILFRFFLQGNHND